MQYRTEDGRYFVVNGRLWRCTNPHLAPDVRERLVKELMAARRAVKTALHEHDAERERHARVQVDQAKTALGERGPVWWDDGAPDLNRHMVRHSVYAQWFRNTSEPS